MTNFLWIKVVCSVILVFGCWESDAQDVTASETSDVILEFLNRKDESRGELMSSESKSVASTLSCIFTEVTVPITFKFRKQGIHDFGKNLMADIVETFVRETNLIPHGSPSSEDVVLGTKLRNCLSHSQGGGEGRQYGGGYGGGHGKNPILGFALLGLKVVGGLAAFLIWDLLNT